jgi:hypothetical protein
MRAPSLTTVEAFLSAVPATERQKVRSGFSHCAVYRYTGPHRFYRAVGRDARGRQANAYGGAWWADENVLIAIAGRLERAAWLDAAERRRAWPVQYRVLTALCEDWNDMSEMFVLALPAGEVVEALAGPAAAQPEFSASDARHDPNRILAGGDPRLTRRKGYSAAGPIEQVFFTVKNPLWIEPVRLW